MAWRTCSTCGRTITTDGGACRYCGNEMHRRSTAHGGVLITEFFLSGSTLLLLAVVYALCVPQAQAALQHLAGQAGPTITVLPHLSYDVQHFAGAAWHNFADFLCTAATVANPWLPR